MDCSNNNNINKDNLDINGQDLNNDLSLNIMNEINSSQNILDIATIEKLIEEREKLRINLIEETENNYSKNISNINMSYIFTGEKSGMKDIDHEKIDKIN